MGIVCVSTLIVATGRPSKVIEFEAERESSRDKLCFILRFLTTLHTTFFQTTICLIIIIIILALSKFNSASLGLNFDRL